MHVWVPSEAPLSPFLGRGLSQGECSYCTCVARATVRSRSGFTIARQRAGLCSSSSQRELSEGRPVARGTPECGTFGEEFPWG